MAGTVNDEILRVTGGPTVNDGLLAFYKAGGASATATLNDAERQWLCIQLAVAVSVPDTNQDLWMKFLAGFPGTLNDKLLAYWSGAVPPPPLNAITALFALGEQGAWFDASDFASMFQDAAGTVPVTAVEQPVGRWLDKSGRNNHATQATAASKPILSSRKNRLLASAVLSTQGVTVIAGQHVLSFTGTGTIAYSGTATGSLVGTGASNRVSVVITPTAGTLTLTVTGDVRLAQLEWGAILTSYQSIVTAVSYDAVGFPFYLRFDGVDDSLQTAAFSLAGSDKVSIIDGVVKTSPTISGMIVEFSPTTGANFGAFFHIFNDPAPGGEVGYRGNLASTLNARYTDASIIYSVFGINIDTAAATDATRIAVRKNGVDLTETYVGGPAGTGAFGVWQLNLGRRNGASVPMPGQMYQMVVRQGATIGASLTGAEQFIAGKMQITIP